METRFFLASLGLAGALASGSALAAGATSTFDTDADGWTVSDFTVGGGTPASWLPAGMIQTFDAYSWTVFSAPAKFLGDQSAVYGGSLSFDLQDTAKDGDADNYFTVVLKGAGLTLSWFGGAPSTTTLAHFDAMLSESDTRWRVGPCTQISLCATVPTAVQFQSALAGLELLQIDADWKSGGDDSRLDNVVLAAAVVPEPESWALMLLGLAGVAGVLRRRR